MKTAWQVRYGFGLRRGNFNVQSCAMSYTSFAAAPMYPIVVEFAKDVPFGHVHGDVESLEHGFLDVRESMLKAIEIREKKIRVLFMLTNMSALANIKTFGWGI